jgi:glucose-6-phosphate 1-epimerase
MFAIACLFVFLIMMTTEKFNQQFGIDKLVTFTKGKGGFTMININSRHATAEISLYGAHLLSYIPKGEKDILWMSEQSLFETGKAIRGGVPICFPWFGPHQTDKNKPQHGFARLQEWNLAAVDQSDNETITVSLSLQESPFSLELWPNSFKAIAAFIMGEQLEIKLTVTNTGKEAFEYSDALHTYFNISDITAINIEGLQNASYYEGFGMDLKTQQTSLLSFHSETNRRYIDHRIDCIIDDPGYGRKIRSGKAGSKVTVVWNPGEATAKTMADIHPDGYKTYVCAEPANAYPGIDMVNLAPGESHTLSTSIRII